MPSIFGILNRLLPFATPGTPILQDVLHLVALCTFLYFAPQIQERLQRPHDLAAAIEDDESPNQPQQLYADAERIPEEANGVGPDALAEGDHDAEDIGAVEDRNDRPEEAEEHIDEGQAGPARAPLISETRNVGVKKAKALARRDQRRAYHEFQRSQGDAQRARDAEGAAERDKMQAAEKERRKTAEAALEAKKAKEREQKRAKEDAQRVEQQRRREQAVQLVKSKLESDRICDLFRIAREVGVDDEEWVERILQSSGMLGRRGDALTMITSVGRAVRVSAADMQRVYDCLLQNEKAFDDEGSVAPITVGNALEASLRQSVV